MRMLADMTEPNRDMDWEAVYWQQMPRIYNFFRYRLGDDALAEDLTATTFTKAWKARVDYRGNAESVVGWLLTIARNVAMDHFRRLRPETSLDEIDPAAGDRPVEDAVQHGNDVARLAALLAQLTPREREVVALKYGAELTNRAIAELTGLSESNVGTILHRVLTRLRTDWERRSQV